RGRATPMCPGEQAQLRFQPLRHRRFQALLHGGCPDGPRLVNDGHRCGVAVDRSAAAYLPRRLRIVGEDSLLLPVGLPCLVAAVLRPRHRRPLDVPADIQVLPGVQHQLGLPEPRGLMHTPGGNRTEEDGLADLTGRGDERVQPHQLAVVVVLQQPGERQRLPPTEPIAALTFQPGDGIGAERATGVVVGWGHEPRPGRIRRDIAELANPRSAFPKNVVSGWGYYLILWRIVNEFGGLRGNYWSGLNARPSHRPQKTECPFAVPRGYRFS